MSATIQVKRNFPSLTALELVTAADMREIGLLARERIIRRTRQGIGPDGQAFAALSPGYAAIKQRELGTSSPDLTVSGRMLNDITITDVTDTSVTLGWTS
jgi:hypothetical protein